MSLAFKSVDQVKQVVLPNVGGPHPVNEEPSRRRDRGRGKSASLTV